MSRKYMLRLLVLSVLLPLPLLAAAPADCTPFLDTRIRRVDMQKVRDAWLGWQNAERKALGIAPLTENPQLNRTATIWSVQAAEQGSITHKRSPGAGYYDYKTIEGWFEGKGLEFANANRSTFSESIGWGPYSCKTGDCTAGLTSAIRSTFDFYMREKGKKDSPHYNAIVRGDFTQVGIGIAVQDGKYYLTTHYATSVTNDPLPLCRSRKGLSL